MTKKFLYTCSNRIAKIISFRHLSRLQRRAAVLAVGLTFVAVGSLVPVSFAASVPLSTYYPNTLRYQAGYYLEGLNYATPGGPSRSVFWFQAQSDGSFKQYNSAPYDTCHWDQLSWKTGVLTYTKTHNQCGTNNNEVVHSPGIQYMPNTWKTGQKWTAQGSAATTYYNQGVAVCQGINTWNSKVLGWEQTAPGVQELHTQVTQSLRWISGSDPSGCAAGFITKWQDDFYLTAAMPVNGTSTVDYALQREVGGNVDTHNQTGKWDYDVQFNSWNHLP